MEISLVRPAEMSQPQKALQHRFEVEAVPDKTTAGRFVAGLLYRTEKWLNEVRVEKHEERVAQRRATLPPDQTSLSLVEVEEMCKHHGLARLQGDDFATFYLEWFITDSPPAEFEQGQWLQAYQNHQLDCEQSLLPLPAEVAPPRISSSWPVPPSEQPLPRS
jgi:hypothetical protein